MIMIAE